MKAHTPKTPKKLIQKEAAHWGSRLRSAMAEKRVSVRKAAELAGVASSVVDSWLGGASPSDLLAVQRLADELGVGFSWLLTGRQEKGARTPTVTEVFETVQFFDGLARIRIDRLVPRNGKASDDEEDAT